MRFLFLLMFLALPVQASDLLRAKQPDPCDYNHEYEGDVDVYGRSVAPADLNSAGRIEAPEVIEYPLTVDLSKHFGLTVPTGILNEASLGVIKINTKTGAAFFNDQPLNGNMKDFCKGE